MSFYNYICFRPWNGLPCYVGKGQGSRVSDHGKLGARHPNPYMAHILAKCERENKELITVIIHQNLTEQEALDNEVALIRAIGRRAHGGPLCNLTDGGEGITGLKHNEDSKKRIGASSKGRTASPQKLAKMRIVASQQWSDPDSREKKLAKMRSAAYRQSMKDMWKDPEMAERIRQAQRAGWARKRSLLRQGN
jgi:hypothetical protein